MQAATIPASTPTHSDSSPADDVAVIARQPIVDAKRAVIGYELLYRSHQYSESAGKVFSVTADAALLFNALSNIDNGALFGNKLGFINCTHESLSGAHLDIVNPENIVLEVPAVEGNRPEAIAALAATLERLTQNGFRLAFGAYALMRSYSAWAPFAAYIKLDMRELKPETVAAAVRIATLQPHARVIAEKVESAAEFELLERLGVKYFQGYYFERPTVISSRVVNPAYASVIQLVNLARKDVDVGKIEILLKRDPTLSFKLLRYINSAGFGLSCEITSFRHAVMILGTKKLYRWAALLLTSIRSKSAPQVVANIAVTRARFMELLASECLTAEESDNAFLTGLFSMLDVMLGVPMTQALDNLALPDDVSSALLDGGGLLGPLLHLAELCERADNTGVVDQARALQLTNEQVNRCHLAAMAWAEKIAE